MASEKPFNYNSRLWLLLNHAILSQKRTPNNENDSSEEIEVSNRWEERYILLTL